MISWMNSTTVCDTSNIRRSRHAWPLPRHAQSDWVRVFKTETEIGTPTRVEAETWKFARQRGSSPALGTRGLYVLWNCYAANSHAATPASSTVGVNSRFSRFQFSAFWSNGLHVASSVFIFAPIFLRFFLFSSSMQGLQYVVTDFLISSCEKSY